LAFSLSKGERKEYPGLFMRLLKTKLCGIIACSIFFRDVPRRAKWPSYSKTLTYFKIVKLGSQTSGPHLGFFLENWTQISKFFKVSFNERLKNTSIANICPGLCPVLFVEVFTRKGPELCKFLDRVLLGQGFRTASLSKT